MRKVRKTIILDDDNYVFLLQLSGRLTEAKASAGLRGYGYTVSSVVNTIVSLLRILEQKRELIKNLINNIDDEEVKTFLRVLGGIE